MLKMWTCRIYKDLKGMHMLDSFEMDRHFLLLLLLHSVHMYLHSSAKRRNNIELLGMQMSTQINRTLLREMLTSYCGCPS